MRIGAECGPSSPRQLSPAQLDLARMEEIEIGQSRQIRRCRQAVFSSGSTRRARAGLARQRHERIAEKSSRQMALRVEENA
jgi:hypothetical protein